MPSSGERKLIQHLQEIFTQEQPKIHYKHETWTHNSGRKIEFDVWYSNMKIAFEYNGSQHYKPSMFGYGNLKAQMQRDEINKNYVQREWNHIIHHTILVG